MCGYCIGKGLWTHLLLQGCVLSSLSPSEEEEDESLEEEEEGRPVSRERSTESAIVARAGRIT